MLGLISKTVWLLFSIFKLYVFWWTCFILTVNRKLTWFSHCPGLTGKSSARLRWQANSSQVSSLNLELIENSSSQILHLDPDVKNTKPIRETQQRVVFYPFLKTIFNPKFMDEYWEIYLCKAYREGPVGSRIGANLLPVHFSSLALVQVVWRDLRAARVFGAFPGQGNGGSITVQQRDAVWGGGSSWSYGIEGKMFSEMDTSLVDNIQYEHSIVYRIIIRCKFKSLTVTLDSVILREWLVIDITHKFTNSQDF